MSFKNNPIVDESKILIDHDITYQLNIFINKKNRFNKSGINIPISIPINVKDINEKLYNINKAIFEIFLSSIALSRLGIPRKNHEINIHISGTLPFYIKNDLERALKFFIISRTLADNQPLKKFSVNITSKKFTNSKFRLNLDKNKAIVSFSGGLDSTTILHFLIENKYEAFPYFFEYESRKNPSDVHKDKNTRDFIMDHYSINPKQFLIKIFLDEIKEIIPWNTKMYKHPYNKDPDVQDRDEWNYYGRNALMAAICLLLSLKKGAKYIEIGHTKEGIFSALIKNKSKTYDRCCSSIYFIKLFNKVLHKIYGNNSPLLITSLINMGKGNIGKYLLKHEDLFSKTRSCIEPFDIECGRCFSCTDKMAAILANIDPFLFKVNIQKKFFEFSYKDKSFAKFQWIPIKNNSGIWGIQLKRFKKYYPNIPHELKNSIYSPHAIIATCYNLSKNPKLIKFIPNEYFKLEENPKIDKNILKKIHDYYTKKKNPILPSHFIKAYRTNSGKT